MPTRPMQIIRSATFLGLRDGLPAEGGEGQASTLTNFYRRRNKLVRRRGQVFVAEATLAMAGGAAGFAAGSSQYLHVADSADLSMGDGVHLTIAGWVYATDNSTAYAILSKAPAAPGTEEYRIANAAGQLFALYRGTAGARSHLAGTIALDDWTFFAVRFTSSNASRIRLTTDTTHSSSAAGAESWGNDGVNPFALGRTADAGGVLYAEGRLDAVGVWKRELSDADVAALYNAGPGKAYADLTDDEKVGLVAFWNLDDLGDPESWIDSHGGHDLTNVNGVTSVEGHL